MKTLTTFFHRGIDRFNSRHYRHHPLHPRIFGNGETFWNNNGKSINGYRKMRLRGT